MAAGGRFLAGNLIVIPPTLFEVWNLIANTADGEGGLLLPGANSIFCFWIRPLLILPLYRLNFLIAIVRAAGVSWRRNIAIILPILPDVRKVSGGAAAESKRGYFYAM